MNLGLIVIEEVRGEVDEVGEMCICVSDVV